MGYVGHKFLPHLVVFPLGGDVVEHRHCAALLVGHRREIQLQNPLAHVQLPGDKIRPLQAQHLLERRLLAEEGFIVVEGHLPAQHTAGGGVVGEHRAVPGKGDHAVGHVEKEGIQLVPLVFHRLQRILEHLRHVVEGGGQNADLVGGFHRNRTAEVPGGYPLRALGQTLDGNNHGLAQQEAQQHGNQQAHQQSLQYNHKQLSVQVRDRVPVVVYINDVCAAAAGNRDGKVHIAGGNIALVPHRAAAGGDAVADRQQVLGDREAGKGVLAVGTGQIRPGPPVQHIVIADIGVQPQIISCSFGTFSSSAQLRRDATKGMLAGLESPNTLSIC